jgi:hypothetical protein
MMGVYRSNQTLETIATAVLLEVLERLATKWQLQPPYPSWKDFAPKFRSYRETVEREATDGLGLSEDWRQGRLDLVKKKVQDENALLNAQIEAEGSQNSRREMLKSNRARVLQMVGGMVIRSETLQWRRVIGLSDCTNPPPPSARSFLVTAPVTDCIERRTPPISWLAP